MDPKTAQILLGAAGASGAADAALYVDDVFSTYLYDGNNSSAVTVTNGIDLSGEGGLVWVKNRDTTQIHILQDTENGTSSYLSSSGTSGSTSISTGVTSFNSDGFTVGSTLSYLTSAYASWTFRKAPGFFDVVTYTGDGTAGRTVAHNLGSVPGFIVVKELSTASNWVCYHRSTGNDYALYLNKTQAADGPNKPSWNQTTPTSTEFTVGVDGYHTNDTNITYVAYLFAHDDQSFGTDGNESIIKCGSVTTGSDEYATVNLGFEPQFVMFKRTDVSGNWLMLDTMRGWNLSNDDKRLYANLNNAESTTSSGHGEINSTGFRIYNLGGSANLIYIAIRRPHKPPEAGTDVFAIDTKSASSANTPSYSANFPVDLAIRRNNITSADSNEWCTRMINSILYSNKTDAEVSGGSTFLDYFAFNNGWATDGSTNSNDYLWMLKRAPGFFDVVAYTGTGSVQTVSHNLTVAPDLILVKRRETAASWQVYNSVSGATKRLILNDTAGAETSSNRWNDTEPTSSVFTVATHSTVNASGGDYIAFLFSNLAGICKISSYTGTGNDVDVDCGFTAGARFILIKNLDTSTINDWYVWDSTRGIVSGDDPYILLNTTAAQVTNTDYIDPLNSGFTVTSSAPAALNTSGGTYLFLAIA